MRCWCGAPSEVALVGDHGPVRLCDRCARRAVLDAARAKAAYVARHPSTRAWGDPVAREVMGFEGERAFAALFDLALDLRRGRWLSDGGVDFTLASGLTVDVKTSRVGSEAAGLVRVEPGRGRAVVIVAAVYDGRAARLVGWDTASRLRAIPPRSVGRHGIPQHAIVLAEARAMDELEAVAWSS